MEAVCAAAVCMMAVCMMAPIHAIAQDQQPSSSAWELLRAKYYGDRPMGVVDENYMSLEVPANTPDPAATPLTLRFADDDHRRIKRVRVFIDNNPSPLVATFDFAGTPVTEINMRVRVDRFTSVRAIAETADGGLEMRSSWVKASGGCSAPPSAAAGGSSAKSVCGPRPMRNPCRSASGIPMPPAFRSIRGPAIRFPPTTFRTST